MEDDGLSGLYDTDEGDGEDEDGDDEDGDGLLGDDGDDGLLADDGDDGDDDDGELGDRLGDEALSDGELGDGDSSSSQQSGVPNTTGTQAQGRVDPIAAADTRITSARYSVGMYSEPSSPVANALPVTVPHRSSTSIVRLQVLHASPLESAASTSESAVPHTVRFSCSSTHRNTGPLSMSIQLTYLSL